MNLSKRPLLHYLGCFLLTQVMAVVFTLWMGGAKWFAAHAYNPSIRIAGYSYRMGQGDCAILIYGDSSAMTAHDPAILAKRTGLTTCNIAEGSPLYQVVGSDQALRDFLRKHAPPRFLVGMWSASVFRPDQPAFQR